jgi:hypothetical protein
VYIICIILLLQFCLKNNKQFNMRRKIVWLKLKCLNLESQFVDHDAWVMWGTISCYIIRYILKILMKSSYKAWHVLFVFLQKYIFDTWHNTRVSIYRLNECKANVEMQLIFVNSHFLQMLTFTLFIYQI